MNKNNQHVWAAQMHNPCSYSTAMQLMLCRVFLANRIEISVEGFLQFYNSTVLWFHLADAFVKGTYNTSKN